MGLLEDIFGLEGRRTTVSREVLGGVTTFMTLSYIIFVQPALMATAGVPRGGALVATCVASAVACLLMAFTANYPIALAPAMGHNFFFALVVCKAASQGGFGFTWQQALAAVFIGGCVFVGLSFFGFRARIMDLIPDGLKRAIAGGIGLMIALLGLKYCGLVAIPMSEMTHFGKMQLTTIAGAAAVLSGGVVLTLLSRPGRRGGTPGRSALVAWLAAGFVAVAALFLAGRATGVVEGLRSFIKWGALNNYVMWLALFGLAVNILLLAVGVRGSIFYGIVLATVAGLLVTRFAGVRVLQTELQPWQSLRPAESLFKLDFSGLLTANGLAVILTFLFLDVFDTVGTLIGVSERAGLLDRHGRLPRARWALFSDAAGTVVGAAMGTSTVTSYIESAAGVQVGARTGLANVVTALLLLASVLLYPFLGIIASEQPYTDATGYTWQLYPVLGPALIVVGLIMLRSLGNIPRDFTELVPAFFTVMIIALAINITEGIAYGFISCGVLKLLSGRARELHWGFYALAAVLVLRYALGLST